MTPEENEAYAWASLRALQAKQRLRDEILRAETERIDRAIMGIELQPARGWTAYDRAFLTDLGIVPLD